MRRRTDGLLASNPRQENWRDYIEACRELVKSGRIPQTVSGGRMAAEVIAEAEEEFIRVEDEFKTTAVLGTETTINLTLETAVEHAFETGRANVKLALSDSRVDGEAEDQAAALAELHRYFNASWDHLRQSL